VPYINNLSAGDLDKGSKSVLIDGEQTALEDASEVTTSTGDEAGTQGGNVITHKTKGKGYFSLWSSTVKIESKGVCRHGDPMGQNCASMPYGCVDQSAVTAINAMNWNPSGQRCPPYVRPPEGTPNAQQRAAISNTACWWAPCTGVATVPDHQPPLVVVWYLGGCRNRAAFGQWAASVAATPRGHCLTHSRSQGGHMSSVSRGMKGPTAAITSFIP
jgi:hypothetical protein